MAGKRLDRQKDFENGAVTFVDLSNGNTKKYTIDEVFGEGAWEALGKLPNGKMAQMAMVHSVNAFGGDAAADKSVDAIEAITARVESVKGGEWSARGGGEGTPRVTVLAEAVARVKNIGADEAAEKISLLDDETKKKLRKHPKVASAIADIQLERNRAKAKALAKEAKETGEELTL